MAEFNAQTYNAAVDALAKQVAAMAKDDADVGADDQVRIFCDAYAASAGDEIALKAKEIS